MAVITVLYIVVNIFNCFKLVVTAVNYLVSLIFSKVGCKDLGIYFSTKPSL